eukprot:scaffold45736_cov30-Tisochrysis_lutea.AAC.1
MVVFGGQDNDHQFNDVWVFDPTTSRWSELRTSGATVAPRMRHTATMVTGERMLVIGGFSRETRYFGDAYLLDLASGTWEALELTGHKFSPRAQHVAVTHDGKNVFIFGGYNGAKNTNDFFLLDVSSGNVSELHTSHPPEARSRHSAHFLNETQLHIIGGFDGGKPCVPPQPLTWHTLYCSRFHGGTISERSDASMQPRTLILVARVCIAGATATSLSWIAPIHLE